MESIGMRSWLPSWRSSLSLQISTVPDLTITLPEPVVIPIIDSRRRNAA
jgi:hypothetical protein